jgi:hypothetical protein
MSEEAEKGNAQPAASPAGTGTAAGVGMGNTDSRSGPKPEVDEDDDDWSPVPGRSWDDDVRIAVHEAGHVVAARLLGHEIGGVTVNPDPARGCEGLCWGVGHTEAFSNGSGDASNVRAALAPIMPQPGEDGSSVSDVFANVYDHCIELMAGQAAERMLLGDDDTRPAVDDLRQARELAMLICRSEEAIETFLSHCDVAAHDLLMPYGDVVIALSTVLRIRRTLDGPEIDALISNVETLKAQAIERRRRADGRKRELSARNFSGGVRSRW